MAIELESEFIEYINSLPIKPGTKKNYRCWVRRIAKYASMDLRSQTARYDDDIEKIAREVVVGFRRDHPRGKWSDADLQSDARCILHHYHRFLESAEVAVEESQKQLDRIGAFNTSSTQEGREKTLRSLALRRGRLKFRSDLLEAYGYSCAVTGTSVEIVLEAAHIVPYNGQSTNHVCNGLLLRSDIHALFDLRLLTIDPETLCILCSEKIRNEATYGRLHGKQLRLPAAENKRPSREALRAHFDSGACA